MGSRRVDETRLRSRLTFKALTLQARWQRVAGIAAVAGVLIAAIGLFLALRDEPGRGILTVRTDRSDPPILLGGLRADEAVPPRFEPDSGQENPCTEWEQWYQDRAKRITDGLVHMQLSANVDASVTIVDAKISSKRRPDTDVAVVRCYEGAGLNLPTSAYVKLQSPMMPITVEDETGKSGVLGEAVFEVGAGSTETLVVVARGEPGSTYEWTMDVTVVVDGDRRTEHVSAPGGRPFVTHTPVDKPPEFAYDFVAGRWSPAKQGTTILSPTTTTAPSRASTVDVPSAQPCEVRMKDNAPGAIRNLEGVSCDDAREVWVTYVTTPWPLCITNGDKQPCAAGNTSAVGFTVASTEWTCAYPTAASSAAKGGVAAVCNSTSPRADFGVWKS